MWNSRCQNASFVLQVLDTLDRSLVKARQYQVRLRQISSQVLTAQEEERKRIANGDILLLHSDDLDELPEQSHDHLDRKSVV